VYKKAEHQTTQDERTVRANSFGRALRHMHWKSDIAITLRNICRRGWLLFLMVSIVLFSALLKSERFSDGVIYKVKVVGLQPPVIYDRITSEGNRLVVEFDNGVRTTSGREVVFGYRTNGFACVQEKQSNVLKRKAYQFIGYETDGRCPEVYTNN